MASRGQALIRFERRGYSVPTRYAGQRLLVRAFTEQLEVWNARCCVARHVRTPGVGEPVVDFWHYLPVLERKPGAFDQALPVRQARFPKEAEELLLALEERWVGDRRQAHKEFLAVCTLHPQVDPVRWRAACATALARAEVSAAGVRAALEGRAGPRPRPRRRCPWCGARLQCRRETPASTGACWVCAGEHRRR